ncbi:DUF3817 domain-containing protein [Nocardioides insulae]|uniref:DUF3817 domain-containing protein n=1 Tax=Nocardioides insulae TaxID=394734 RepID=UPI000404CC3C|nr:DUF3817 domain-containing protein [Nocardioides insulae]
MNARTVFRTIAIAEACSWAGLLIGMFFKYVPETTEAGVQIFGPIHGAMFVLYCLGVLVIGFSQRWSMGRLVLGLFSSIPPLMTLWFDRYAEKRGWIPERLGRSATESA